VAWETYQGTAPATPIEILPAAAASVRTAEESRFADSQCAAFPERRVDPCRNFLSDV